MKLREEHIPFYNRIWRKDDPFWSRHQPGNCYGCKCDWVETYEEPTEGNPKIGNSAAKGLNSNPGLQGEIFTADHSYMAKLNGNEKVIRQIAATEVKIDNIRISLMADSKEMLDNIRTGKVLAQGGEDVYLRPDFNMHSVGFGEHVKNPEYTINGGIADAKRIHSDKGISAGFSAAIKQGCSVVIIDYNKHNASINPHEAAVRISRRIADFSNGKIRMCYIVKNSKYVKIDSEIFQKYPSDDVISRTARIDYIEGEIKKALD